MHRGFGIVLVGLALGAASWLALAPWAEDRSPGDGTPGADPGAAPAETPAGSRRPPGLVAPSAPSRFARGVPPVPGATSPGTLPAAPKAPTYEPLAIQDPAREMIVTVNVRGPDGVEIEKARVTLVQAGYSDGAMAEGGRVRRKMNRGRGRLTVEATEARGPKGQLLPYGWARIAVAEADEAPLTIDLPHELTVTGRVRGPHGEGVAGVLLKAEPTWTRETAYPGGHYPVESTARTAPDGSFRLGGLGAGEVFLTAVTPPAYQAPEGLTVWAGAGGVDVALELAVTPVVTVLTHDGEPVKGAIIFAYGDPNAPSAKRPAMGGGVVHGGNNLTDAQGAYRVPSLDPATKYRLDVRPPRDRADLIGTSIEHWEPKDTTLRLLSGLSITGAVRDARGNGVSHASIYWRKGGRWKSGNVRKDGTFTLDAFESSEELQIYATVTGRLPDEGATDDPFTAAQRVRAGAKNVILTLDPGADLVVVADGWPAARGFVQGVLFGEGLRGGRTTHVSSHVYEGGRLVWHGLEPQGEYMVWIPPEGGERSALLRGLRAGGEPVKVTLEEGRAITGALTLPEGAKEAFVGALLPNTPFYVHLHRVPAGRFEIRGLPAGTSWTVVGVADVGQRRFEVRSLEPVLAGGSFDLDLAKPR